MKIAKLFLLGALAGIFVGCSSDQNPNNANSNGNVSVSQPYTPDVGVTTNTVTEPAGAAATEGNR